mmetsp:Transcript_13037/g.23774  ORF Transcript_13037/g.23774 Transcript_13037/m.23774 type:complete len:551 (+) Transcript_13037:729-2381(+)
MLPICLLLLDALPQLIGRGILAIEHADKHLAHGIDVVQVCGRFTGIHQRLLVDEIQVTNDGLTVAHAVHKGHPKIPNLNVAVFDQNVVRLEVAVDDLVEAEAFERQNELLGVLQVCFCDRGIGVVHHETRGLDLAANPFGQGLVAQFVHQNEVVAAGVGHIRLLKPHDEAAWPHFPHRRHLRRDSFQRKGPEHRDLLHREHAPRALLLHLHHFSERPFAQKSCFLVIALDFGGEALEFGGDFRVLQVVLNAALPGVRQHLRGAHDRAVLHHPGDDHRAVVLLASLMLEPCEVRLDHERRPFVAVLRGIDSLLPQKFHKPLHGLVRRGVHEFDDLRREQIVPQAVRAHHDDVLLHQLEVLHYTVLGHVLALHGNERMPGGGGLEHVRHVELPLGLLGHEHHLPVADDQQVAVPEIGSGQGAVARNRGQEHSAGPTVFVIRCLDSVKSLRHDLYGVNDIVVAAGDRKLLRVLHHVVGQDGGVLLCGAAGGDAVGNPQDAAGHEEAVLSAVHRAVFAAPPRLRPSAAILVHLARAIGGVLQGIRRQSFRSSVT